MDARNAFRSIVALSLVLSILAAVSGYFPSNISDDWKTVLEWSGQGGVFEYLKDNIPQGTLARGALFLLLIALVAYAVAVEIGMFLFWRFARTGYVVLTGVFIVLAAFDGLVVATPWESAMDGLALVIDGVVITLSYSQAIGGYFERLDA